MFDKKFQLNEQNLSAIQEIGRHMPGGFFIYRAEEPENLIYANRIVFRIFGCADEEEFRQLTGYTFRGMVHPEDYDAVKASICQQIEETGEKMDCAEYRIIRKDGKVRWVDDYGHYTVTETYGGIYYVFISDITEKKERMESDRKKHRKELNNMITAMASDYRSVYHADLDADDGVCYRADAQDTTDREGVHFPFHSHFEEYCRLYVDEKYQEGFLQFIDPPEIRKALATENIIAYRYLIHRDGKDKYEMLRMAGVRHPADRDDHIVHAVGLGFTDIDNEMRENLEQQRALVEALEAAKQASRAKTAFLSSMSHEIRTPMNAIIGLNRVALNDPEVPARTRELLEKIDASAQHLLGLINEVLEVSRIESGRMTMRNEKFSFRDLLEQVNAMTEGQCKDKGLQYDFRTDGRIDEFYIGDESKLRQVMINILGNAVKFTPAGGSVSFRIEEGRRYAGKAALKMTFRDTGIGMSPEFLPRLFDAFSQENTDSANPYGSTGLGMSIVKSIVELMNGRIEVESEKDRGTVVTVTVALEETEQPDNRKEQTEVRKTDPDSGRTEAENGPELQGKHMLLAEDVEINADIMVMVLGMQGMTADVAKNGRIAVEKFLSQPPGTYDAVLMDMRMPEMDGLEATRRIRKSGREDAERIPIIALSANALDEDVQRSMQAGLNAHLSKPVEPETLYQTLKKQLKKTLV